MAPEQVRGQAADHRADIFALGAVLFEMLTGARAFGGDAAIDTMSAILRSDPLDTGERTAHIPANCRVLIQRCLEKQPSERFESMRDLAFQLQALSTASTTSERVLNVRPSRRWRQIALLFAVGIAASAIGALVARRFVVATPLGATHVLIDVRPADDFGTNPFQPAGGFRRSLGWSPDGRTLGFIAQKENVRRVYLRPLGSDEATPLAGTEGADTFVFSPDGSVSWSTAISPSWVSTACRHKACWHTSLIRLSAMRNQNW